MFVFVQMVLWVKMKNKYNKYKSFLSLGDRCENERNECEPVNPCLNSGRCMDRLNNFSCICSPGKIRKIILI